MKIAQYWREYTAEPADRRRFFFYLAVAGALLIAAALIIWNYPDPVKQVRALGPIA
jgi:hypothetical protein